MERVIYFLLISLYTLLPLLGLFVGSLLKEKFSFDFSELITANIIHVCILFIGLLAALRGVKSRGYAWNVTEIDIKKTHRVLLRTRNVLFYMAIISFVLSGWQIFAGVSRGVVRVNLGMFGWLVTFINSYGMPGMFSLAVVYYYFFSSKDRRNKKLFWQIVFFALLIAIMKGGKSSIVVACFAPLLQYSPLLKKKQLILLGIFGGLSIIAIGMREMNMNFNQAFNYNIYRATSLSTYGTMCVWDLCPDGADTAYLTLWGSLGRQLTSFLTGIDSHSVEFLDYSLARKITYLYYGNAEGALSGTVNLTITSFGEMVFWLGRRYYFIFSSLMAIFVYCLTIKVFQTRAYRTIKTNILFTIYFATVFIGWLNSASISSLFGLTTLCYLLLLNMMLRYVVIK